MGKLGLSRLQYWRCLTKVKFKQSKLRYELLRNTIRVYRLFFFPSPEEANVSSSEVVRVSSSELLEMASDEVTSFDSQDLQ